MRIVSENSETDLARQRALDQVDWKIRELTANLLRITRGAGKPYEIMTQMIELAEAIRGYHAATGLSPYADEFARALNVSNDLETMQHWRAEDRDREYAEERIIRRSSGRGFTLGPPENPGGSRAPRDVRWSEST
jgi:hypothetical protein